MSQNPGLSNQNSEELFAAAIARLEAGEPLEVILASCPSEQQAELQEFLQIIEATVQLQRTPAPRPSPARRAARKQAFLQAATELKADYTAPTPLAPLPVAAPRQIKPTPGLWARMRDGWAAFQASFAIRPMSLAPLVGMIVAVWLGSFGFVALAEASTPGDRVYDVVVQWIRYQELNLTPEEKRPEVAARQAMEQAADVAAAQNKAKREQTFIQAEDTLIFHGNDPKHPILMLIGSLAVIKSYDVYNEQGQVQSYDTQIEGVLKPGVLVKLVYQITPNQELDNRTPRVQGIRVRVLPTQFPTSTPPPTPTMTPTNTPLPPTATPTDATTPSECIASRSGWVPYWGQAGQNLADLAARAGIDVAELLQVNCLSSEILPETKLILVPPDVNSQQTPTIDVTPPSSITPTVDMTPTIVVTATVEASPTATENTPTPTALPITATVVTTSTIAPTEVVTATPTLASTITPSNTAEAPPTNTGEATPSATPTVTPLTTPDVTDGTPTPTDASDATATPAETATPTGQETSQPETPTVTASATGTPIPAEGATTTPTTAEVGPSEAPTAAHTPIPVDTPTPSATLPPILPTEEPTVSGAGVKDFATATFTPTAFRTVAPMPTATRTVPPPNESPLRSPR